MIRVKLADKKYIIPSELNELSIDFYQKINKVDSTSEIDKIVDYLEILSGIDKKLVKSINIDDIRKITKNLDFNSNKGDLVDAVKIENSIYVFDKDLSNMRFDMFIDLEEMTKDMDIVVENLHLIMAILYRPAKKKRWYKRKLEITDYDSDTVKERAEFFKQNLMMDKVTGSLFFFINLRTKYMEALTVFLEKKVKETKEKI